MFPTQSRTRLFAKYATTLMALVVMLFLIARIGVANEIVFERDLVYGSGEGQKLLLDIAYPKYGPGPYPAIVFIHGGAWAGGTKQSYEGLIQKAARNNYVAASIDYRVTNFDPQTKIAKTPFPAQIQDCKCAIRWMRAKAENYRIDKNRIGVTGGSAGGHLSLLVGMTDGVGAFEGDGGHPEQPSSVKAVVNHCGPTDLVREYNDAPVVRDFLFALCIGNPDSATENYKIASPVNYISKSLPPILTLHGDADDIVPVSQARLLDEQMRKAGALHEISIFEGAGHDFKIGKDKSGDAWPEAEKLMFAFFEKHLAPE